MIVLHGVQTWLGPDSSSSLGDFFTTGDLTTVIQPLLEQCYARQLPMVCCNPDFIMIKPDGTQGYMPGTIARAYEQLGGSVKHFGKPYREHFEACVRDLGLPKSQVVHVGDSLHHDICGANATGVDSIFVTGGVHLAEVDGELGSLPSVEALEKLFAKHGETPTHVVPMLRL